MQASVGSWTMLKPLVSKALRNSFWGTFMPTIQIYYVRFERAVILPMKPTISLEALNDFRKEVMTDDKI
jgi:hypothetical protein